MLPCCICKCLAELERLSLARDQVIWVPQVNQVRPPLGCVSAHL